MKKSDNNLGSYHGYSVGDEIAVEWDDASRPLRAKILHIRRSHHRMVCKVQMKDGSIETITESQIVKKARR